MPLLSDKLAQKPAASPFSPVTGIVIAPSLHDLKELYDIDQLCSLLILTAAVESHKEEFVLAYAFPCCGLSHSFPSATVQNASFRVTEYFQVSHIPHGSGNLVIMMESM